MPKMPINKYIDGYCSCGFSRFHMPGHKGKALHGLEPRDITEIQGADYLYEADGIIAESEALTSRIFGSAATFYSTEGSSLSIKSMLAIICQNRKDKQRKPLIIAPRNVHKAFINGCCLLDIDVKWVYPSKPSTELCSSDVTAVDIKKAIEESEQLPDAIYITSPDYLGNMADIPAVSAICEEYGVTLAVDNAHGAYLKFLESSLHPIDLGADICCDSAHKTLPVYTGGSYLHISKSAPESFIGCAKSAMALFASTSPSYLIMGSLDRCLGELQGDLPERIRACAEKVASVCERLLAIGWQALQNEPLKLTIQASCNGYTGQEIAEILRQNRIECEYADHRYIVLMCSPYNDDKDYERLISAFSEIPRRGVKSENTDDIIPEAVVKVPIREAYFSDYERLAVDKAEGRICARTALSSTPSIPIIVSGELVTKHIIKILKKYSIFYVDVIK